MNEIGEIGYISFNDPPTRVMIVERRGDLLKVIALDGEMIGIDPMAESAGIGLLNSPIDWINARWISDSPETKPVAIEISPEYIQKYNERKLAYARAELANALKYGNVTSFEHWSNEVARIEAELNIGREQDIEDHEVIGDLIMGPR
jgi:hypothetical protein